MIKSESDEVEILAVTTNMRNFGVSFSILAICVLLAACATYELPEASRPALILDKNFVGAGTMNVDFPAGIYLPSHEDSRGVYYSPENGTIVTRGVFNSKKGLAWTGGVFIPFPDQKDQRQGFWIRDKDLLFFNLRRFDEHVPFRELPGPTENIRK
jgi:hypothetical protein